MAILLWVLPPYCQCSIDTCIAILFYSTYIAIQMAIIFWKSTTFEFFASLAVRLSFSLHLPVGLLETLLPYSLLKIEIYAVKLDWVNDVITKASLTDLLKRRVRLAASQEAGSTSASGSDTPTTSAEPSGTGSFFAHFAARRHMQDAEESIRVTGHCITSQCCCRETLFSWRESIHTSAIKSK